MTPGDSWEEYQRLVIAELQRHNNLLTSLDKRYGDLRTEVAKLQVKSGIWGAVAGCIVTGLAIVTRYFPTGG